MVKQKSDKERQMLPKTFWIILIAVVVFAVGALSWFLLWRTGWPDYAQAVNKCGGRPPIVASSFIAHTYTKPSDKSYKIPPAAGAIPHVYYCTEQEAISAGYKHSID